jgi:hypothetical protein
MLTLLLLAAGALALLPVALLLSVLFRADDDGTWHFETAGGGSCPVGAWRALPLLCIGWLRKWGLWPDPPALPDDEDEHGD